MTLRTRRPTGIAPWPLILLEGGEKAGKSYACAALSASPRVGRVLYFDLGEHAADQYGAIPGVSYEVVEHDGSYHDLLGQLDACLALPVDPAVPQVVVLDSISNVWSMLVDAAQATANARARKRGRNRDSDASITMDLWNEAKGKWRAIITRLQEFEGIAVLTARGREVAAVEGGTPTGDSTWKVEGEKSLAYDVDVWVRLTRDAAPQLIGARSLVAGVRPGIDPAVTLRNFSLESLIFDVLEVGGKRVVTQLSDPDMLSEVDAKTAVLDAVVAETGLSRDQAKPLALEYWQASGLPTPTKTTDVDDLIADIRKSAPSQTQEANHA